MPMKNAPDLHRRRRHKKSKLAADQVTEMTEDQHGLSNDIGLPKWEFQVAGAIP
jgi:hypothetical protein